MHATIQHPNLHLLLYKPGQFLIGLLHKNTKKMTFFKSKSLVRLEQPLFLCLLRLLLELQASKILRAAVLVLIPQHIIHLPKNVRTKGTLALRRSALVSPQSSALKRRQHQQNYTNRQKDLKSSARHTRRYICNISNWKRNLQYLKICTFAPIVLFATL